MGIALQVLLVLGILAACCHHHETGSAEDSCALCALVHVVVIPPSGVDVLATSHVFIGYLPSRSATPLPNSRPSALRSRAPPLS
jgi:hypothetical protein